MDELNYNFGIVSIPFFTLFMVIVKRFGCEDSISRIVMFLFCWMLLYNNSLLLVSFLLKTCRLSYLSSLFSDLSNSKPSNSHMLPLLKRFIVSQLYCCVAVTSGLLLLTSKHVSWPDDLLHPWSSSHLIAFEVSVAYWTYSLYADVACGSAITMHDNFGSTKERTAMYLFYTRGLISHHVFTIFAFTWILWTHYLSGLGVMGLLFEFPVLLLNLRDIAVSYKNDRYPDLWVHVTPYMFNLCVLIMYTLWHTFRTIPSLLWVYSILMWQANLNALPLSSRIVYHMLGAGFTQLNWMVLSTVVARYIDNDAFFVNRTHGLPTPFRDANGDLIDDDKESKEKEVAAKAEQAALGVGTVLMDDRDCSYKGLQPEEVVVEKSAPSQNTALPISEEYNEEKDSALLDITQEMLALHNSVESGAVWISLHSKVYDITAFIEVHPGGAAVLQKVAGQDASTVFEEVGHSRMARRMMSKFCIGKLQVDDENNIEDDSGTEPQEENGTFMHTLVGDENDAFDPESHYYRDTMPFLMCGMLYVAAVIFYASYFESRHSVDDPTLFELSVTSFFSAGALLIFATTCLSLYFYCICGGTFSHAEPESVFGRYKPSLSAQNAVSFCISVSLNFRVHLSAIALICMLICDVLLLRYSMKGLRFSLWLSYLFEIVRKKLAVSTPQNPLLQDKTVLFLLAGTVIDFYYMWNSNSPMLCRFMVAGAFIRYFYSRWFERIEYCSSQSSYAVILVASIYVIPVMVFVFYITSIAHTEIAGLFLWSALKFVGTISFVCWTLFIVCFGTLIYWSNASFAIQSLSLHGVLALAAVGHYGSGWIATFFIFVGLLLVSADTFNTLEGRGSSAPKYLYPAKQMEYVFRSFLANFLTGVIVSPLVKIASALAPDGKKYWMCPGQVIDLGPRADYGIAYQVNGIPQQKPTVFQCNVGFLDMDTDIMHTTQSTKKMLQELINDPEAGEKGFVSDMVVMFPLGMNSKTRQETGYNFREVNLSSWASEKAAHDWYMNSPAHKKIVSSYYNRELLGFSSMISPLIPHPSKPPRWDNRCRECNEVNKGPDPKNCAFCKAEMRPMPYM